jgi:hypothetical protein
MAGTLKHSRIAAARAAHILFMLDKKLLGSPSDRNTPEMDEIGRRGLSVVISTLRPSPRQDGAQKKQAYSHDRFPSEFDLICLRPRKITPGNILLPLRVCGAV